jgi:hypothetical protein
MPSGYFQIVNYGLEDVYLTGNPEITFFKFMIKRYSRFTMENIKMTFQYIQDLTKRTSYSIAKLDNAGDLIKNVYMKIEIPPVLNYSWYYNQIDNPVYLKINNFFSLKDNPVQIIDTQKPAIFGEIVSDIIDSAIIIKGTVLCYYYADTQVIDPLDPTFKANAIKNNKILYSGYPNIAFEYIGYNSYPVYQDEKLAPLNSKTLYNQDPDYLFLQPTVPVYPSSLIPKDVADNIIFHKGVLINFDTSNLIELQFGNYIVFAYNFTLRIEEVYSNTLSTFITFDNTDDNIYQFLQRKSVYTHIAEKNLYTDETMYRLNGDYLNDPKNFRWRVYPFLDVSLYINGVEVVNYPLSHIIGGLYRSAEKKQLDIINRMIGFVPELQNPQVYPTPEYSLIFPLPFWFSRAEPLPICTFPQYPAEVRVNFNTLNKDINIESNGYSANFWFTGLPFTQPFLRQDIDLQVEYIFLDPKEREIIVKNNHKFLIEQTKIQTEIITENIPELLFKLDLQNPISELAIYFTMPSSLLGQPVDANLTPQVDAQYVESIELIVNGEVREQVKGSTYMNTVVPYRYHRGDTGLHIYYFSFSLDPQNLRQPNGAFNFTKANNSYLRVKFAYSGFYLNTKLKYSSTGPVKTISPLTGLGYYNYTVDTPESYTTMIVVATNYNVLNVIGGFPTLIFN